MTARETAVFYLSVSYATEERRIQALVDILELAFNAGVDAARLQIANFVKPKNNQHDPNDRRSNQDGQVVGEDHKVGGQVHDARRSS